LALTCYQLLIVFIFAAMTILNYLIWTGNPEIVSFQVPFLDFTITLRWYGLLFALGFLISQQLLYYIFKKEGKPEKDVDTLTIYMVVATVIGARLGHVLFYEPERYLSNPLDIIKIWEGGLASHGAAIGILFALWLYARKNKPGQNYMQILDRIVILVALTGALIRFGNFFNSEIIGKPTHSDYGVVFARNVTEVLKSDDYVQSVSYVKSDSAATPEGFQPIKILLQFKPGQNTYQEYAQYLDGRVNSFMTYNTYVKEHIHQPGYLDYKLAQDEVGQYYAIINTYAISRYPAQLYESFTCVLLFAFLFWIWTKHKENLPAGRIFGIFMIALWSLRFVYEFFKENQVDFENTLPLNMGQILSIPLVLIGIIVLIRSYRNQNKTV
jgi:phosphatidylglycerol---prolipoprotein diacylglyceryl transferase